MNQSTQPTEIETLEPQAVWRLFGGIAAVPRPSKREQRIREYVRSIAQDKGFAVREDETGNMVIEVPASPTCESAPITVLQGHLDMVCEMNAGTQHDFENDPIRLVMDRDAATGERIVRADGTTLGADNGIGVAMAMAAASSPEVQHGPLEILCTVDEEAGMSGAKALAPDFVLGKRMINLDAEEDDIIYIGCAGGRDTSLTWSLSLEAPPAGGETYRVSVSGLKGGHSGGDIHLNRGNAVKLLAATLAGAIRDDLQIGELRGGRLRNAIPREAGATIMGSAALGEALRQSAAVVQQQAVDDHGEAGCRIAVESGERPAEVISAADSTRVVDALTALPHGVLAVVPEIPGLVQTSNNLATAQWEKVNGAVQFGVNCLSRSSVQSRLHTAADQVAAIGRLTGAKVESGNEYPGWQPDVDSPLLKTCREVYERLFDESPTVTAIHAGLECGLIGERVGGGMDMVSIGPRIRGAHSPDERVYVDSVQKSWRFLTAILAELARP